MTDQTDRDAVAATLAAHRENVVAVIAEALWDGDANRGQPDYDWVATYYDDADSSQPLADVLAPLLAQARAEAVAAALAPVEQALDEWETTALPPVMRALLHNTRAAVAEGKEAGRG